MATGIVERADAALSIAHDDDRVCADLNGHVRAGFWQLAIVADKQPIAIEDVFQIKLVEIRISIKFLLQAEIWVAPGQKPQHFVANVHSLEPSVFCRWIGLLLFSQRPWPDPVFP